MLKKPLIQIIYNHFNAFLWLTNIGSSFFGFPTLGLFNRFKSYPFGNHSSLYNDN